MNKKIDIDNFERRVPFSVPDGYFIYLKSDIQNRCKSGEKKSFFEIFKPVVTVLGILLILFAIFNIKDTNSSDVELTNNDLIAYIEDDLSDHFLYEYSFIDYENEEDEFIEEINYLLEYDSDYIFY